jgi:hypothetical protein
MAKLEKLLARAREHLEPGEEVLAAIEGVYESDSWGEDTSLRSILAATDRRVVLYAKKLIGQEFKAFPYETITSFEEKKTFRTRTVTLVAAKKRVRLKFVKPDDLPAFAEAVRRRIPEAG